MLDSKTDVKQNGVFLYGRAIAKLNEKIIIKWPTPGKNVWCPMTKILARHSLTNFERGMKLKHIKACIDSARSNVYASTYRAYSLFNSNFLQKGARGRPLSS